MCVAIPGRIIWVGEPTTASRPARIDSGGIVHHVDLVMVPDADIGDYVVAHSGYAVRRVPPDQARDARALIGLDLGGTARPD